MIIMIWIVIIVGAILIYAYPKQSLEFFRKTVWFILSIFNPKMVESQNELNILMGPIYEVTNKSNTDLASSTSRHPFEIFSTALNKVNAEPFLKKWASYIEKSKRWGKNNHPVHNDILQLFDIVGRKVDRLDDKNDRRGFEFMLLARDYRAFRLALEYNVNYTPPGIIAMFARWCRMDKLTSFVIECFSDPTFLNSLYIKANGDSRFGLILDVIGIYREDCSIKDIQTRWEIIQSSQFWKGWPSSQIDYKYETSRIIDKYLMEHKS